MCGCVIAGVRSTVPNRSPDRPLDPHRRAPWRGELDVEEIVVNIAQESVHDALLDEPRQWDPFERALRVRRNRRRVGDLGVGERRHSLSHPLEKLGLLCGFRHRRSGAAAAIDRLGRVFEHALVGGDIVVGFLVHEVRPIHELGGDPEVAERQWVGRVGKRFAPDAQEVRSRRLVRDAVDEGDVGHVHSPEAGQKS